MELIPAARTAHATVYGGHVLETLRALPDATVDCVVTSPPYWGLRAYGTAPQVWGGDSACSHVWATPMYAERTSAAGSDKQASNRGANAVVSSMSSCELCDAWRGELGLEPTPELYVAHIVEIFAELRRILRPTGTAWLNLGDSYASKPGQGGAIDEMFIARGKRIVRGAGRWSKGTRYVAELKPKDLVGIPWRVAFALQAEGWWLRSEVVWSKPNPMPESVTDRPTKSHEQLFMLAKSERYYFDQNAVREDFVDDRNGNPGTYARTGAPAKGANNARADLGFLNNGGGWNADGAASGRNVRSVWEIPTEGYEGAHFATFPPELPRRCISAGTSERGVCSECGAPMALVVVRGRSEHHCSPLCPQHRDWRTSGRTAEGQQAKWKRYGGFENTARSSGEWARTCKHEAEIVPATVLDPFAGSGTTLAVAVELGRDALGVELQPDYIALIERRCAAAELERSRGEDGPMRAEPVRDLGPLWEGIT